MTDSELSILIGITIGLVEVIKYIDEKKELNRFYPLFSLVIGVALGVVFNFGVFSGMLVGLSASGLYRGFKVVRGDE